MAVSDTWRRRDGSRTPRYGEGRRWRVRWQGRSRNFDSKVAAERYWLRIRTEQPMPESEATVGDLLDRWLATKRGLSERGYRACQDAARHVRAKWGDREAATISREEIQAWIGGLGWSASLLHKVLQALSGSLRLLPGENPAAGVRVPKQTRREARFLSADELADLARECDGYAPLIWLLGTTGLRIGEACALNVGDVDRRRRRIRVRTSKTGLARDVPVPSGVLGMLDLQRPRTEPLITTEAGTRVLVDNWRARHFRPATERAELGDMTVHDLRHTAASLAIASGADVMVVQRMLGHADASMTLRVYSHLWDKGLDEVAGRMDDLIQG